MPSTAMSVPCVVCGYPIQMPTYQGQQVKCPYCGQISEAIAQVATSSTILVGIIGFFAGVVLGPAFLASTKAGSEWLGRMASKRIK